jgi:hypothetical protein
MTVGFSTYKFIEFVEWDVGSSCSILERCPLNYSFLINSKNGTEILILCISFSKLKEEGDFRISLIFGTWALITG